MIAVIDINGVIADVRRHEAPAVKHRAPDVVLPNRQKVYMHPACEEIFKWLHDSMIPVITFTSRTSKNAAPIEKWLADNCPDYSPILSMYGEDCCGLKYPPEPWRPMKAARFVRSKLRDLGYNDCTSLLFVDDHPDRIQLCDPGRGLKDARVVVVPSYNALTTDDETAEMDMRDIMWSIHDMMQPSAETGVVAETNSS